MKIIIIERRYEIDTYHDRAQVKDKVVTRNRVDGVNFIKAGSNTDLIIKGYLQIHVIYLI